MAEKDITEKILADYNDIFADIVNVLLFDGKKIINENDLETTNSKSMYKTEKKIHELERDVSKFWLQSNIRISLIGFEHQTAHDSDMPLRVIGYDGSSYRAQCLNEESAQAHYPVITVVLNFGMHKWTKHKQLSDCFDIPDALKPYFSDYKINVFNIAFLSDDQVAMFKSDFRIVADYFVQMRKNKKYKPKEETIKHVDEVLKLMSVLTKDNRFLEAQNTESGKKVTNMCEALDIIENKGIAKGIAKGKAEGEAIMKKAMQLIYNEKLTAVDELVAHGIPKDTAIKALS